MHIVSTAPTNEAATWSNNPMPITKIVLISIKGYDPGYEPLLRSFLDRGVKLFSVVGKGCRDWEDAMDVLCESGDASWLSVVTTSHPDESIDEVMAFVQLSSLAGEVQVITV